jgi:hypothetical protein
VLVGHTHPGVLQQLLNVKVLQLSQQVLLVRFEQFYGELGLDVA